MKKILIIYPHWPPSNLAGVHRARLIANFLHEYSWHPIVLTVKHEFYEETKDWDILKTVSPDIEVHYTDAHKVGKPRIIGDIGIRAFPFLKKEALRLLNEQKIDFVWIPIPSFYTAILGRQLYEKTKIPYGIDYIDPWVRNISNRKNLRSIVSLFVAKLLEPYAIKKAALISGVSENYYRPAIERNFKKHKPIQIAMPYGFDPHDHDILIENIVYPWKKISTVKPIVYAGAFLPNSSNFLTLLFKHISQQIKQNNWDKNIHLYFLGTGFYTHKSITAYAEDFGISHYVHEIHERFAFIDILNFLSASYGLMVLGSTEKHYTASKIYQSILSQRPIFAIFHNKSSVCKVMEETNTDRYLCKYSPEVKKEKLTEEIKTKWNSFLAQEQTWAPHMQALNKYSAKESANRLVQGIEKVLRT